MSWAALAQVGPGEQERPWNRAGRETGPEPGREAGPAGAGLGRARHVHAPAGALRPRHGRPAQALQETLDVVPEHRVAAQQDPQGQARVGLQHPADLPQGLGDRDIEQFQGQYVHA